MLSDGGKPNPVPNKEAANPAPKQEEDFKLDKNSSAYFENMKNADFKQSEKFSGDFKPHDNPQNARSSRNISAFAVQNGLTDMDVSAPKQTQSTKPQNGMFGADSPMSSLFSSLLANKMGAGKAEKSGEIMKVDTIKPKSKAQVIDKFAPIRFAGYKTQCLVNTMYKYMFNLKNIR